MFIIALSLKLPRMGKWKYTGRVRAEKSFSRIDFSANKMRKKFEFMEIFSMNSKMEKIKNFNQNMNPKMEKIEIFN